MKGYSKVSAWIASCNPDQLLQMWKHCADNNKHFDELMTLINARLEPVYTADPEEVRKKLHDIRKGLEGAFERMAGIHKDDGVMLAKIEKGRANIPADLVGMGTPRANYNQMLMGLSGSSDRPDSN